MTILESMLPFTAHALSCFIILWFHILDDICYFPIKALQSGT